jgi:hypothetical protein
MVKLLIMGLLGAATMAAGIFIDLSMKKSALQHSSNTESDPKIEQVATELTGAPIIVAGRVDGYIVFKVRSTIDRSKLGVADLDVAPYLLNAAFSASYELFQNGPTSIHPRDIEGLTERVAEFANKRLGVVAVSDVELEQFNYIPSDKVRENVFSTH